MTTKVLNRYVIDAREPLLAPATPAADPILVVRLSTNTAAFCDERGDVDDGARASEVASILHHLADLIDAPDLGWTWRPLHDANGNTVGEAVLL